MTGAEWLNFIASIVGSIAWPAALITSLLVFRKAVRKVIEAIAQRIPQMKQLFGPAGSGATFGFDAEINKMAEEVPSQNLDEEDAGTAPTNLPSSPDSLPPLSGNDVDRPQLPMSDQASTPQPKDDEHFEVSERNLPEAYPRELEAQFIKTINDFLLISPPFAINEAYRFVENAVASLISPDVPIALQGLPASQDLVRVFGLSTSDAAILDDLYRIWGESQQAKDPNSISDEAVAKYAQTAYYIANRIRGLRAKRRALLNMIDRYQQDNSGAKKGG